jgi:PKD repeat protein
VVGGPTYAGGDFPAGYEGTTFFGDYGSGLLRRFDPVGGGSVTTFATNAAPWVDLETAPAGLSYAHAGDLVYVSIGDFTDGTGSVGRILYTAGGRTPVPVASGNPTTGDPPLTVAFSGQRSSDPDGDSLTFDWDFGDGSAHSSRPDPSHEYAKRGPYIARLTVTDGEGLSAAASVPVTVGGPEVTIATPTNGSLYRDGAVVTPQGSASDFAGHAVPDSGLQSCTTRPPTSTPWARSTAARRASRRW